MGHGRRLRVAVLCAAAAALLAPAGRLFAGSFEIVPAAYQGQAAPGTIGNSPYLYLDGPMPGIDNDGRVTLGAVLDSPMFGTEGLWNGRPGAMSNLVFEGYPTPDDPAQSFRLSDSLVFDFHLQRGGLLTYDALYQNGDGSQNGATWMRTADGGSTRILYDGMPLPVGAAPAGAVLASGRPIVSVAPGDGGYAYRTNLQVGPGGVTSADSSGVWAVRNGATTLIARQGDHAPGAAATANFTTFQNPAVSADGTVVFRAQAGTASGFWRSDGTTLSPVAVTGQAAPQLPAGVKIGTLINYTPRFSDDGDFAVDSILTGTGVTSSNNSAIWRADSAGDMHLVVRSGTPSPAGGTFTSVSTVPFIDNSDRMLFGGVTSTYNGYFRATPAGVQTIAITGAQAPDVAAGNTFLTFYPPQVNAAGWAVFDATLKNPAGAAIPDYLFAMDPDGNVSLVAGPGTTVEVAPGVTAQLLHAQLYSSSDVELSELNDRNEVVFYATFTNGTAAVLVATLPEPGGALLLGGVAALAIRRRRRAAGRRPRRASAAP